MRRRERKQLEAFVRARTRELTDESLRAAHTALLTLIDQLRREAAKEADWEWVEAIAAGIFDDDWGDDSTEDAIFGDDPETQATQLSTAMLAAMALTHSAHADYRPAWTPRTPRRGGAPGQSGSFSRSTPRWPSRPRDCNDPSEST